jgi:hypothetical protein
LTYPFAYGIVKIMEKERDFWSGNHPLGHCATASLFPARIERMTKEKKTFAWDTVMTLSLTSDKMTVKGTDIEVKWCPITKMFWEI